MCLKWLSRSWRFIWNWLSSQTSFSSFLGNIFTKSQPRYSYRVYCYKTSILEVGLAEWWMKNNEWRKLKNESKKVRKITMEPKHFTKKTTDKNKNLKSLIPRCDPCKLFSTFKICNIKSILRKWLKPPFLHKLCYLCIINYAW